MRKKINIETRRSTTPGKRVILANLLCIVPIFSYVTPKGTMMDLGAWGPWFELCILLNSRGRR